MTERVQQLQTHCNSVVISINDVNEASPVFAAGATDAQNVEETTTVATYSATDADGRFNDIFNCRFWN